MAAAIWSSSPSEILGFPAATFLRFCINHRLLQVEGRPQWRSIVGGGRQYVARMAESLDVRLNHPVQEVIREGSAVKLTSQGATSIYDAVIFATHAHETLNMLKEADRLEQELLGSVRYQPNRAVLQTDRRFLPQRESLWSAWNYRSVGDDDSSACVTYLLCPVFCLRINADEFDVLDGWLFGVDHTGSSAFHCADYAEEVSR